MLTFTPEICYFYQISAARPASHNLLKVGMRIRFSTGIILATKILERRRALIQGHIMFSGPVFREALG